MRRIILMLSMAAVTATSWAQFRPLERRNHTVNRLLKEVASAPDFKTAGFAFMAIDLQSGETIAALNPDMSLRPASTLKLLSTATAIELLGPEHRFNTELGYSGEIDTARRVLKGKIIIKGGGDPTLGSRYLDPPLADYFLGNWAAAIRDLGIDSVSGGVVGDARIFSPYMVPPAWSWQNMGQYYGAGPGGLSIYDNAYSIHLNTGENVGDTAVITKVTPEILDLTFENGVTADTISYDNAYIFGAPYDYDRTIRGQIPLGKEDFEVRGSMPDPALVAARQLDSILKRGLVNTREPATTARLMQKQGKLLTASGKVLMVQHSPTLADIISITNTQSVNLFAEHCLIHSGISLGAFPETGPSADSVISFWNSVGMDIRGLSMADGSGLSQYNAMTPRQIVYLLAYMKRVSPHSDAFYNSMAIAGRTGTLEHMFRGSVAEGKLRAKSGTISRVKAYAGYVTSISGRDIAFSLVVNNFSGTSVEATEKLEQLMIALAEFNK